MFQEFRRLEKGKGKMNLLHDIKSFLHRSNSTGETEEINNKLKLNPSTNLVYYTSEYFRNFDHDDSKKIYSIIVAPVEWCDEKCVLVIIKDITETKNS
jgi:hypothetical protein